MRADESRLAPKRGAHTFAIGEKDFLLDGQRLQIRCAELHFARIPREYWRHRLRLCKAMGMNAVCAYLFWNYHEWEPGQFEWSGQADVAEFCRMAQEEGLWVLLRPGPYVCAEWEMGGLPWWLLKKPDVALRTRDPEYLAASRAWLKEVGRVLGPQQITHGGPILMVQVENEYGFYGDDTAYLGELRQDLLDAGFDVPLFSCNPVSVLRKARREDLFQVVNFGSDPAGSFNALRAIQPKGPLMCGEFYPGWFDTWGAPHHRGDTPRYLADLEYMLKAGASFSMYMAHGGTSFGTWAGADQPFKPDTSSYDYDAPISESGQIGEKFRRTRELMARYLLPGETLPDPPSANSTVAVPRFELTESASIWDNLPAPAATHAAAQTMEAYHQGRGCILYRTTLPAGPAGALEAKEVHDFAWVFLNGEEVGVMDRRSRRFRVPLPARAGPARLDILVEAMGRVNFGQGIHDRKGLHAPVRLAAGSVETVLSDWTVHSLDLGKGLLSGLRWKRAATHGPAFWRGRFEVAAPADTFLDVSSWGKGVLWVNGHCLGRFWNIGPTQTMYLPGPWLKKGRNEVVVLDLLGPEEAVLAGRDEPILDQLRPELDFGRQPSAPKARLALDGVKPVHSGAFGDGPQAQEVKFASPAEGRQFCLEAISSQNGSPYAAVAELDLLDDKGSPIPHAAWTLAYVDSEERDKEDGSALNAIDGQTSNFWHTEWGARQPAYPHQLVIDLGAHFRIGGFRYTPRADNANGRIKGYRIYVGDGLARGQK
jgi:beta-galactosidase